MEKITVVTPWHNASSNNGSTCVDVQHLSDGTTQVRNSKRPDGAIIDYTQEEWAAFLDGVRSGEFNHPTV